MLKENKVWGLFRKVRQQMWDAMEEKDNKRTDAKGIQLGLISKILETNPACLGGSDEYDFDKNLKAKGSMR